MSDTAQSHQDGYVKWLRSQVGHELIYLVYTISLVFDDEHRLLVQERYDFDWLSVPGGIVEPDETIAEAALREIHEETGIEAEIERLIGVFSHPEHNLLYPNGDRVQPWAAAFLCRAKNHEIKVDGQETLEAEFRPVEEIFDRLPLMYQYAVQAVLDDTLPYIEPVHYEQTTMPYYPILRKHVGPARVILPGCIGAVFNENGHVLAVRKVNKNYFSLPGGLSDLGETTSGTICREILEETGLEVAPFDIVGIYSQPDIMYLKLASGDELQTVDLLVACRVVDGQPRADGIEIAEIRFMPIDELLIQAEIKPIHRQFFEDLRHRENWPYIR